MKINIEDLKNPCCGCGACYAICPNESIVYEQNQEGFYTASVNEEKCIKCKKCVKVCLKEFDDTINDVEVGTLYSMQSSNMETIKKCTSGGIAYEIAEYGINNGYNILGVVYNYDENIAETILTRDINDLEKIKGSKYIQSKSNGAFRKVIEICKKDEKEKFIIFGTPCQIYGIKKAIETQKIKNKVICIDLFCHGVPSYLVWKKYLDELKSRKNIDDIKEIIFRDKKYGWHNFTINISSGKKTYYVKAERSDFYSIFFDNVLLDPSCVKCEVRKKYSNADIRLGDFWGKKYIKNNDGISAVVVITKKGEEIMNGIKDTVNLIQKEELNTCLKYQSTHDYIDYGIYDKIMKNIKTDILSNTIKKYRKFMPKKYLIKQKVKNIISYLPMWLIRILKNIK